MSVTENRAGQFFGRVKDRIAANLQNRNVDEAWLKGNIAGLELMAGLLAGIYLNNSEVVLGSAAVGITEFGRNMLYIVKKGSPPLHV